MKFTNTGTKVNLDESKWIRVHISSPINIYVSSLVRLVLNYGTP